VFGEAAASAPPRGARSRERQQSNLQKDFYTPSGHAPENLATLRRLALNMLKREKKKRSIKGKMLNASWDHAYLLKLLGI